MTQNSRKRKLRSHDDDQEYEYEKQPRLLKVKHQNVKKVKIRNLLPLKDASGKIIQKSYKEVIEEPVSMTFETEKHSKPEKADKVPSSTKEFIKRRQDIIEEKKNQIANCASSVLANPEGNIGMLKNLRLLLEDKQHPESLVTIRKLVTASLGCLFVDIIPGYRIRERTEKEKTARLSKEVKARYNFEETLILQYQLFLKNLEKMVKRRINPGNTIIISPEGHYSIGEIAIRTLADLMTSTMHFNFHSNIIVTFVPIANNDKDPAMRQLCCDAISTVFTTDKKGSVSLNLVKTIARLAKKQGPRKLKVEFIATLLSLRIKVVDYSMIAGRNKQEKKKKAEEIKKMSRNQRKQMKKEKKLKNELKEAAATEDYDERIKMHTEIVQQVFLIYFRILKHKNGESADCRKILPCVLEGLAKFAHLINITFFGDLIKVLQQLVTSGSLTLRENLHSIYSVFAILSGQGEVINVDPVEFYKLVYNIAFQLLHVRDKKANNLKVLLDCTHLMLDKRRKHVTLVTLCAFIKRLFALALQLHSPSDVISVLKQIKRLLLSNSKSRSLFDKESEALGDYDAEIEEPLHSKAQCATLWEIHLLRRHYAPLVSQTARNLFHQAAKS